MKKKFLSPKTVLAGLVVLAVAPTAVALSGGAYFSTGGYTGPMPTSWFDATDPCLVQPITIVESLPFAREWQIDASAVAADNDPNTFVRCTHRANDSTNHCIAGKSDGAVISCRDESGPHVLPRPGDIVYIQIDPGAPQFCNVSIGTGDTFGKADPKCRTGGGSGGSTGGGGGLGCTALNSTPVVKAAVTALTANQCYSFNKTQGTLRFGNWSGTTSTVSVSDSTANLTSANIGTGNWFSVVGVADGTVYFKVTTSFSGQVDSW